MQPAKQQHKQKQAYAPFTLQRLKKPQINHFLLAAAQLEDSPLDGSDAADKLQRRKQLNQ